MSGISRNIDRITTGVNEVYPNETVYKHIKIPLCVGLSSQKKIARPRCVL